MVLHGSLCIGTKYEDFKLLYDIKYDAVVAENMDFLEEYIHCLTARNPIKGNTIFIYIIATR